MGVGISHILVGKPSRQRSRAHPHAFRNIRFVDAASCQPFLHFILDQSAKRSLSRAPLAQCSVADRLERLEQVGIFGDQRQSQRLSREYEAIGRRSERYRTAIEALEITKLGGMPEDETRFGRADVAADNFTQRLQDHGDPKFCVLLNSMPGKPNKADLQYRHIGFLYYFQMHGLVYNTEIALQQRERFTYTFRC